MSALKFRRAVLFTGAAAMLGACSITPERSALVPATYQFKARHEGAVRVVVQGGEDSNLWGEGINIPNDVFAGAVEDAIKKSGLFRGVVQDPSAPFRIDVALQRLTRPTAGFGMESQLGALWVLRGSSPDRVIWQDLIVTTGEASVGDAFSGFTRSRMAVERAAQNNIQRALQEISQVSLRAP